MGVDYVTIDSTGNVLLSAAGEVILTAADFPPCCCVIPLYELIRCADGYTTGWGLPDAAGLSGGTYQYIIDGICYTPRADPSSGLTDVSDMSPVLHDGTSGGIPPGESCYAANVCRDVYKAVVRCSDCTFMGWIKWPADTTDNTSYSLTVAGEVYSVGAGAHGTVFRTRPNAPPTGTIFAPSDWPDPVTLPYPECVTPPDCDPAPQDPQPLNQARACFGISPDLVYGVPGEWADGKVFRQPDGTCLKLDLTLPPTTDYVSTAITTDAVDTCVECCTGDCPPDLPTSVSLALPDITGCIALGDCGSGGDMVLMGPSIDCDYVATDDCLGSTVATSRTAILTFTSECVWELQIRLGVLADAIYRNVGLYGSYSLISSSGAGCDWPAFVVIS